MTATVAHPAHTYEVCIGRPAEIPQAQGRAYYVDGREIAVFHLRDGRIFAIDNTCPHRGGPLADGIVGGHEVVCPLHSWRFDLTSGRGLTDPCGVRSYPVRQIDGFIYLTVGTEDDDE